MIQLEVGKIVGLPVNGTWGQVHDFVPEEEEKAKRKGRLIAAVSIKVDTEDNLAMVSTGREVLVRLHELYFGDREGEQGGGRSKVVDEVRTVIDTMAREYPGIEIAMVVAVGGAVYAAAVGGGGIKVREGEREGWLINPKEGDGRGEVLSGWAKEGMMFIIGNDKFWQEIPEGVVRASLTGRGVEEAAESLGTMVFGRGKSEGEVGAVIKVVGLGEGEEEGEELGGRKEQDKAGGLVKPAEDAPVLKEEVVPPEREETRFLEGGKKWGGGRGKWMEVWKGLKSKLSQRPTFVIHGGDGMMSREVARKRMRRTGLGFLVVVILLFAGGRLYKHMTDKDQQRQNQQIVTLMRSYEEARALVGLNQTRARQLLTDVRNQIDELDDKTKKDVRIAELMAEFGEVLGAASGVKKVEGVEVVDLGLIRENLSGRKMARGEGTIWVAGSEGRMVEVDPARKSGRIVWGREDVGDVSGVATYPGKVYGWQKDGMKECTISSKQCKLVVVSDGGWGEVADVKVWAANIYVLDRGNGEIWKYQGGENGVGSRVGWVAEGEEKGGLQTGTGMAIDGSVWVAGGGRVVKYTRGVVEHFEIGGMDKALGENLVIDTGDEAEKLYVLDSSNARVVAITKQNGEYSEQLVWDKMKAMTDMVVDERGKKVYLLGEGRVWEVGL